MKWRTSRRARRVVVTTAALAALALAPAPAATAATLHGADVAVTMRADGCDAQVRLDLETTGPETVDHRLLLAENAHLSDVEITGTARSPTSVIGRTASLPLAFGGKGRWSYQLRYRVGFDGTRVSRCPVWVPAAPADGLSRAVHVAVALPPGATPSADVFPSFAWDTGGRGHVVLGHLPAFVFVHYTDPAHPISWLEGLGVRRAVDGAAILILACATGAWALAHRRR